jgi:hypothetical protein
MRSKHEIRAHRQLTKEGWLVDFKHRPILGSRYTSVDYFNLFDLLAYKPGQLRCISIKSQYLPGQHKRDIEAFKLPAPITKEIWVYKKSKTDARRWIPKPYLIP